MRGFWLWVWTSIIGGTAGISGILFWLFGDDIKSLWKAARRRALRAISRRGAGPIDPAIPAKLPEPPPPPDLLLVELRSFREAIIDGARWRWEWDKDPLREPII